MSCKHTIVLLITCSNVLSLLRVDPLVDTNVGLIRGLVANDGDYSMFLGIPYAKVDEGNPFGAAASYPKFEEPFEAYDDSTVCPQNYYGNIIGTINCLHLNIFVPNSASSHNRLPVMVWVHGGAFMHGDGTRKLYDPRYLVKHDVIIVSINYRLSAYGFMCLDVPGVPGNQGLKDQVLAFQWIRDNIAAFAGDPDKITLFGESAGGHAIDLHLISPGDKLYNRIILQSGSSLARTVLYEPDKLAPLKLAAALDYETEDIYEALEFLSNTNSHLIIAAVTDLGLVFKPCVEDIFDGIEPFITKHWVNKEVPKVKDMAVLLGFNEHESAFTHMNQGPEHFENLGNIVANNLKQLFDFNDTEFIRMTDLVKHYYFGDEDVNETNKWGIVRFDSDITYLYPIHRTIKKYLESGAGDIYLYMFTYIGGRNLIERDEFDPLKNNMTLCCVSHADDLAYLFDMNNKPEFTEQDRLTMERMTLMCTNFAKYGDPTPVTTELLPVKWIPLTKDTYNYLNIGTEISVSRRPMNRRMTFWKLFYKQNGQFERNYEDNT